jgi:hypothetical protein
MMIRPGHRLRIIQGEQLMDKKPNNEFMWFALCLAISVILTQPAVAMESGTQTYTLKAPGYSIKPTGDGFDKVRIEGYFSYAVPGYPDLPCRVFRFAVPPDVAGQDIVVEYAVKKEETVGLFTIKELPPLATRGGDKVVFGGKADVYSKDAYLPEKVIEYLGVSQMRKWKFISVKYTPFQYNPIKKVLRYIPEVEVKITYQRMGRVAAADTTLWDDKMDERARGLLDNYAQAEEWYKPDKAPSQPSATHDYVIITTNAIESASTKLGDFVSHLSGKGFSPLVITEDEYAGLTGQSPNGTAEKIRQWLIDHYTGYGIVYVLLIGNPDPDDPSDSSDSVGDVPMKMCWPRRHADRYVDYKESPTDYFYADLTGNWDLNGNGYFGEYNGDRGTGGVDFANEVYVGRIPVYSGVSSLDSVLTKAINYGNEPGSSIGWRKSALLPMSFSDEDTDGAYLSEAMISDYLGPNGYSDYTLYMQAWYCAAADSSFSCDEELRNDKSWQRWRDHDYGMVCWWGHGGIWGAYIGWDGCPAGWSPIIISSGYASHLDDAHPAHVYQCSCSNGHPEVSDNLGTALLYHGAVTTVSASRVSWYSGEAWNTGKKYYCDNASIGYYYCQGLVDDDKEASRALFDIKSDMGVNSNEMWFDGGSWMNLFDFNLYGDPATSIVSSFSYQCPDCPADGVITNATYRTGTTCSCANATAITLGSNVTVESGATATFAAPRVSIQPGFRAASGSKVTMHKD